MDSELLKCRTTDHVFSEQLHKARTLMYKLRYAVQNHRPNDYKLVDYCTRLKSHLERRVNSTPPVNYVGFAMYVTLYALYYICDDLINPQNRLKEKTLIEYAQVVDKFTALILLGDESDITTAPVNDLMKRMAHVYSMVSFEGIVASTTNPYNFICPLCIIDSIYEGVGRTEFVCPVDDEYKVTKICHHVIPPKPDDPAPYDLLYS